VIVLERIQLADEPLWASASSIVKGASIPQACKPDVIVLERIQLADEPLWASDLPQKV